MQQWGTLAVAVLGAMSGIAATLMTDSVRSRREAAHRRDEHRRSTYVRYLNALERTHSRMTIAAFQPGSRGRRDFAVHQAFHNDPQHADPKSLLSELEIIASEPVAVAARAVLQQLRQVRDTLATRDFDAESEEYQEAMQPYREGLAELKRVMRGDV
ncbi:hypothetical protein ACFY6U_25700 [Streptomyces sp. NPDC013157]|uniref:hypothetical protein n=1 Tax=Streptomyces sp. NPDC013157 TaxID=3364861 RepID=UPI00367766D9